MTTVDVPDDAFRIASEQASAACLQVRDWVANAILAHARGDITVDASGEIPVDDCGFPTPVRTGESNAGEASTATTRPVDPAKREASTVK